jgi:acetoacetyl-CoA synthetase
MDDYRNILTDTAQRPGTTVPAARPLWAPSAPRVAKTAMAAFRAAASRAAGVSLDAPSALHRWSIDHAEQFWPLLCEHVGLRFVDPPSEVTSDDPMPGTRWFRGGTLNYAQHLLEGAADSATAIIVVDDDHRTREVTFGELRRDVGCAAAVLDQSGVVPGDRVAAYLPNGLDAVVVLLACAARGAVFTSCSPTMGVEATIDRFAQVDPKLLFLTDGYWSGGKYHRSDAERLVAALPTVQRVVCVPGRGDVTPGYPSWKDAMQAVTPALRFVPLPFDHPLYILYTSGTTGLPKCIVHRAGGALLTHLKEHRLHSDVREKDVVFFQTNTGWMMWNWLVSALASRATIVLFGGTLFHPSRDALWRLVDRLGITHFGTSATHIHSCMRINMRPRELADLGALRCVLSTGSPLSPEGFEWVYSSVKSDVHLASISGGTDIVGCFMMGDPTSPVYAGQIQGPALGVALSAYDEAGAPVVGKPAELVCRRPLPSMPLRFWNDDGDVKYRETYFSKYPDVWRHGDRIEITPEGGVVVWGRSDATLKPGGVRIGTGEIYRALEDVPEVVEALAAGKEDGHDVAIWLFVVLRPGAKLDRELQRRLSNVVLKRTTAQHVPRSIFQVADLPRTHSGKVMELAATHVINGREVDNVSAIANPETLTALAVAAGVAPPRGSEGSRS